MRISFILLFNEKIITLLRDTIACYTEEKYKVRLIGLVLKLIFSVISVSFVICVRVNVFPQSK